MLPFLRSQKLYILKPGVDCRAAVHPEQFHAGRRQPGADRDEQPTTPDAERWAELPRADLLAGSFAGQPLHRVALTTDAGLGKTYNLAWLCHELNDRARSLLAFVLPLGELDSPADLIARRLVHDVRNVPGNEHEDPSRLRADLEALRQRGQLVLLFDGLDMAGDASVKALARLLEPQGEWGRCRIVVAGRPFALDRHWEQLFARRPWQFVQIAEFDANQQRAALGKLDDGRDRYDLIPKEARNILTTPRVLEYLQPLGTDQLERLKTVADVYWQGCGYMLHKALRRRVDVLTRQRYLALLGALAFTMYARTESQAETGELRPNLDRIAALDMPLFLDDVRNRLKLAVPDYSKKEFQKDLRKLSRLNALLNHGWLDVSTVGGAGKDFLWRNASLQEFFAAYWVTRWGNTSLTRQRRKGPPDTSLTRQRRKDPANTSLTRQRRKGDPSLALQACEALSGGPEADTGRLRDWVVDPLTDANRGFYWFWRYAAEMPDEAILPNSKDPPISWQAAMAPLYNGPIRSTEFIYRSWERMERGNAEPLRQFLAEFPAIRAGKQGAKERAIAEKMLAGFIPLVGSGKPGDTGTFIMGAPPDEDPEWDSWEGKQNNPQHKVTLSPFCLHRFCVTNVEYELFDPRHKDHRWWRDEQHPSVKESGKQTSDDSCPVVNVSWYDAWCFARWTGNHLPTEAQWEYACRGGATSYQTFHFGDSLSSKQANFNGSYPYGGAKKSAYLGCTTTVGSYEPNAFGLYDMHGNVWEWCADWYAAGFYETEAGQRRDSVNDELASARVLRGGGWDGLGRSCRSAIRVRHAPGYRSRYYGFRLAAVSCVVGAKSG
jgi:formylglycine-generating enzyme required for sulfatase activity